MVWPLTDNGRPAASADKRARLVEAVPLCMAVPITRSSISPGSIFARSTAARMASALMDGDLRSLNAPRKALAIGVRAVETITASCMVVCSNGISHKAGGSMPPAGVEEQVQGDCWRVRQRHAQSVRLRRPVAPRP
ncbi:hypothetical protein D3C75_981050 [compost metagenome]